MACEFAEKGWKYSKQKSYWKASKHNKKEAQKGHEVVQIANLISSLAQGDHGVVQDHCHSVIEQGLTKDQEVQTLVDTNFIKNGQDCHWINSRYQRAEKK